MEGSFEGVSSFPGAKARVAELVDAADSKSAVRKDVLVRFQSRALDSPCISLILIDLQGFIISGRHFYSLFTASYRFF